VYAITVATAAEDAEAGRRVLLVVNTASHDSLEVGAYYAAKRNIPARNICRLLMPLDETISRETYRAAVAHPVFEFLKSRQLAERIEYIVTTMGVPLRVTGSSGPDGEAASVDSELTVLGEHEPRLAGGVPNPYYAHDTPFHRAEFGIYLVTRLAAYDVASVKGMIDRSLEARNRGRVVLDLRSGDDDSGGDRWLRLAKLALPPDRVVIDETAKVLEGVKDVIGYASWGSNDHARKTRFAGLGWLPGGIATEYVSSDARTFQRPPEGWNITTWARSDQPRWFAGSPQSLTADFIAEGATGASGHVYEPYLANTPRPNLLFPGYLSGRNLAESYYMAIPLLSWQNVVIGDPLCRLR
jgi:uncharacterized protein (TIGR03790 family)